MTTKRTENWTKEFHNAVVEVTPEETVIVSYPVLRELLTELGWEKHTVTYTSDGLP